MRFYLIIICFLITGAALGQQITDAIEPEGGSVSQVVTGSDEVVAGLFAKKAGRPVRAEKFMVVAANPLAVEAGVNILAKGGSAADAMVAVQAVLGLVEPQSSGLGGGAFLVWYDEATSSITTLDGRETAPLSVTPKLFLDKHGEPIGFYDAVVGGLSVGTPGTPALLDDMHKRWGRMSWSDLFVDATMLARSGFAVSPRLANLIERDAERLMRYTVTADYFLPGGVPLSVGTILKNSEYAETLQIIAEEGSRTFYSGRIAQEIEKTVQYSNDNPGVLSQRDLAAYQVKQRDPVCVKYRKYDVCGMGPPSSGGLTIGQILGQLNQYDLAALGPDSPESWRLIGDASRLAFADRGRYMADSDFVPMPTKGLLDPAYLFARSSLLNTDLALKEVVPGNPDFDHALIWSDDESFELPSTSHISIVDSFGNVASMTTTIENAFGSRLMVNGFLLNNELTDFSFRTHRDGVPVANAIAPGKRPRSSMSPTIILRDGEPVLAIGSPGGSRIIGYTAKTIISYIDWGMNIQEAISSPHVINRFGVFDIEQDTLAENLTPALEAMGFQVKARELNSGLHAIAIGDGLQGGADPRREGIAMGH
ncbi:MAG: gamma-glutamyltransferase [Alphaproteobacteria bacterium]|nr:gamma-glutamyltransferase [Alphaproteobacteria bacterium]